MEQSPGAPGLYSVNCPRLCRGPHRLHLVLQTPLPFWRCPHHFLHGPGQPKILIHLPQGPPPGSSGGKVPTGGICIFISAPSGPQLQTLSAERRIMLILLCPQKQGFPPKGGNVGTKVVPYKETEGVNLKSCWHDGIEDAGDSGQSCRTWPALCF